MKNSSKGEPVAAGNAIMPLAMTRERLSQLFREHYRRVLSAAYRITGSMADAEDIAQTVFLRIASVDTPTSASVGSYLYRAAINGALDLLRHRKAAPASPFEDASRVASLAAGSSPEAEASGRELGKMLRIAVSELPARGAEMFILRYVEELGNREIAGMMGTSQAVVAVTLHNMRSRLKKRLMEMDGERR